MSEQSLTPPSCDQLAQRKGIIGIVSDLPSDLATNRKYFQEFGK